jgi:pilus assembly protein CpaF
MTDIEKAQMLIEQSFLQPWLIQTDITDISYNGQQLYYQSTLYGRHFASDQITYEQVYSFLKQIANYLNKGFSYSEPILDMSVGAYRIHAVGPLITRKNYHPSLSFSLRIHRYHDGQLSLFLPKESLYRDLVIGFIKRKKSIVISGVTGVGKTQLQKELIYLMEPSTRVIIIDNILELDGLMADHLDMTIWQVSGQQNFLTLMVAALRSHPDWLLIAESRGEEFTNVYMSVLTGHPIITTIHSGEISHVYTRMKSMLTKDQPNSYDEHILESLRFHFPVIIHLNKETIDGKIHRFIEHISYFIQEKMYLITDDNIANMLEVVFND